MSFHVLGSKLAKNYSPRQWSVGDLSFLVCQLCTWDQSPSLPWSTFFLRTELPPSIAQFWTQNLASRWFSVTQYTVFPVWFWSMETCISSWSTTMFLLIFLYILLLYSMIFMHSEQNRYIETWIYSTNLTKHILFFLHFSFHSQLLALVMALLIFHLKY